MWQMIRARSRRALRCLHKNYEYVLQANLALFELRVSVCLAHFYVVTGQTREQIIMEIVMKVTWKKPELWRMRNDVLL